MPQPPVATQLPDTLRPEHQQAIEYVRSWAVAIGPLHKLMRRDYEFVNGRDATRANKLNVSSTGRELLSFNEVRPQFELLSGHRAGQQLNYVASPRGREDKRLAAIASTTLEAFYDFMKKDEVTRRSGDDGDICGLGAVHFGHSFDDAEDVVWGDLFLERISPFSFVFDLWGTSPHYRDAQFMGHRWFLTDKAFRKRYPSASATPASNDWFSAMQQVFGAMDGNAPASALLNEMVNSEQTHLAVFKLYYREPRTLYFVADAETGDIYDGGKSEEDAEKKKQALLKEKVDRRLGSLKVIPQNIEDEIAFVIANEAGEFVLDEQTGQPQIFASIEEAEGYIADKKKTLSAIYEKNWKIWKRKRSVIKWIEFNAFETLDRGELPVYVRNLPYEVYISKHLGDEIEDIEGVVRQIVDRQKEITKRYNHLADHLAHASHSGWLNKKGEGADSGQLAKAGSRPGVVVEYLTTPPAKIQPSEIPTGHFLLANEAVAGIQRTTGGNMDLQGLTSNSTVSGEAISARQRGGLVMQFGRLQNYEDFDRRLAESLLALIQSSVPVEKIRRILGVWEAKTQTQINGQPVFLDPISAMPAREEELLDLLVTMKSTKFDLTLKPVPVDMSVRERQFTRALQLMQMITSTGRPIGPTTMRETSELSDLPDRLVAALEADARAEQQQALAQQQQGSIESAINERKATNGPQG